MAVCGAVVAYGEELSAYASGEGVEGRGGVGYELSGYSSVGGDGGGD